MALLFTIDSIDLPEKNSLWELVFLMVLMVQWYFLLCVDTLQIKKKKMFGTKHSFGQLRLKMK